MTDRQLSLLLRQYALRIRVLAEDVEELIEEGPRLDEKVWVGEGPEPMFGSFLSSDEWETRPEGDFVAVTRILDFADELETEAFVLQEVKKDD